MHYKHKHFIIVITIYGTFIKCTIIIIFNTSVIFTFINFQSSKIWSPTKFPDSTSHVSWIKTCVCWCWIWMLWRSRFKVGCFMSLRVLIWMSMLFYCAPWECGCWLACYWSSFCRLQGRWCKIWVFNYEFLIVLCLCYICVLFSIGIEQQLCTNRMPNMANNVLSDYLVSNY